MRYPIPSDADTPCRHGPPDRWFPRTGDQATAATVAKECTACPWREDCLDWGLHREVSGIWGGKTAVQLARMRKRLGIIVAVPYMSVEGRFGERPRRPAPPPDHHQCGSLAGYSAHRRRREQVCDACQQAQHDYSAQHRPGRAS